MPGESAFEAGDHLVAQSHVGKCPAPHDFVIPTSRTVGIEIGWLDAASLQIFSGGTVFLNGASGRNVVGGDAVSQYRQHARATDILDRRRLQRHIVKVRSAADVSRGFIPRISFSLGNWQPAPAVIAVIDLAIT